MSTKTKKALTLRMENRSVFVNLDVFVGNIKKRDQTTLTIPLHGQDECPGSFALTPASMTTAATVYGLSLAGVIRGQCLDWGCGNGVLSLVAAAAPRVERVIGLDIAQANVDAARANATLSGCSNAVFVRGDGFRPLESFVWGGQAFTAADDNGGEMLRGIDVVLANPPASSGDDGFGFRRRILREAPSVLRPGGLLVMQWLSYYTGGGPGPIPERVREALEEAPEMRYRGVVGSSEWVPLGTARQRETGSSAAGTLLQQIKDYADEEARGGLRYFCTPTDPEFPGSDAAATAAEPAGRERLVVHLRGLGDGDGEEGPPMTVETCTAAETLERARAGHEPLCRWQCHLFERAAG